MVTDYSRDAMNEYAKTANQVAKNIGSTTVAMTDATTVFAQAGFDLPQSTQLAQMSVKLANASGQTSDVTSDQITAYMNAYGMDSNMEELSKALDAWAEVANVSAADVQELATASQKAASTANTVGVNMDQLAAQIATIESVTKDAPENIGNGLKTIYARFSDISMGETLEDGVDLGQVTGALGKAGISALDSNGKMREVGDIMEDLMNVWGQMDQTQKAAIATTLAGKYQLSRFEALMNRSDLYNQYKQSAQEGKDKGTLDVMNEKYVDSLEGRLNKLQATFEGLFTDIFDTTDFNPLIDGLTNVVDLMNQFIDSIGGGSTALTGLGAVATRVFSNAMARGINNTISNMTASRQKKDNQREMAENGLASMGLTSVKGKSNKEFVDVVQNNLQYVDSMSTEQAQEYNQKVETAVQLKNQQIDKEEELYQLALAINTIWGETLVEITKAEDGSMKIDLSKYQENVASSSGKDLLDNIASQSKEIQTSIEDYAKRYSTISAIQKLIPSKGVSEKDTLETYQELEQKLKKIYETVDLGDAQLRADLKEVVSALGDMNEETIESAIHVERLQSAYDNLAVSAKHAGDTYASLATDESVNKKVSKMSLDEAMNSATSSKEYAKQSVEDVKDAGRNMEQQEKYKNIINVASAVGDLAFAWQSFQSLGSLWKNTDLSTGEKLQQTIMNIATQLPMLIMAFESISNAGIFSAGKKGITSLLGGTGTFMKQLAAWSTRGAMGSVFSDIALGAKNATVAVGGLNNALKLLGGWVGIVASIAGTIAIAKITSDIDANTKAVENARQAAEDASSAYDSISSKTSTFDNAYKTYKDTGQVTDELKSSADELSESLGLQSERVLAARGNWDAFAESVKNATKAEREKAEQAYKTSFESNSSNREGGYATNGSFWSNGQKDTVLNGLSSVEPDFVGSGDFLVDNSSEKSKFEELVGLSSEAVKQTESFGEIYSLVNQSIKTINDKIEEVDKEKTATTDESKLQELTNKRKELTDFLAKEQQWIQDWGDDEQALQGYSDLRFQDEDIQNAVKDSFSFEDAKEKIAQSSPELADYITSLGDWSNQVNYLIQNTSDEAAKIRLSLEKSKTSFGQQLYTKMSDEGFGVDKNNLFNSEFINVNGYNDSGIFQNYETVSAISQSTGLDAKQIYDSLVQGIIDEVNESGLSAEEQADLYNSVDWSQSINDIQKTIGQKLASQAQQADKANNTTDFGGTFTDRSTISDSDLTDLLKETDMTKNAFDRMSSSLKNDAGNQIQEQIQSLKDLGDEGEDTQDKIDSLEQAYNNLGQTSKDITAYNLKMNKGLQDLGDNWE
ncbi:MAG TPA: phage tail tape measure protein, partial [Lachnospiraceae bacterium]|nr:phage tail tape measure protein [Lachnospiraceae bacterium]